MIQYIIFGVGFSFLMSVLGASLVFFFKKEMDKKTNTIFFALSAGIMFAATIWSLLIPAIEKSEYLGNLKFIPACLGIILGSLFFVLLDFIIKIINNNRNSNKKIKLTTSTKIFLGVTIHNIPEGLAIGFAFGVALLTKEMSSYIQAISLAIGIGIQNFPEGAATSLPLKSEFNSRGKAFLFGFLSALIEPIAAGIGMILAYKIAGIMSYILSFAAGAMIYVIIEELLPECFKEENNKLGTWCFILGFIIMLILDVAFG